MQSQPSLRSSACYTSQNIHSPIPLGREVQLIPQKPSAKRPSSLPHLSSVIHPHLSITAFAAPVNLSSFSVILSRSPHASCRSNRAFASRFDSALKSPVVTSKLLLSSSTSFCASRKLFSYFSSRVRLYFADLNCFLSSACSVLMLLRPSIPAWNCAMVLLITDRFSVVRTASVLLGLLDVSIASALSEWLGAVAPSLTLSCRRGTLDRCSCVFTPCPLPWVTLFLLSFSFSFRLQS